MPVEPRVSDEDAARAVVDFGGCLAEASLRLGYDRNALRQRWQRREDFARMVGTMMLQGGPPLVFAKQGAQPCHLCSAGLVGLHAVESTGLVRKGRRCPRCLGLGHEVSWAKWRKGGADVH